MTATQPSIDQLYANDLAQNAGVNNALLNVGCRPYASSTSWASNGVKNTAADRSLQAVHRPVRAAAA